MQCSYDAREIKCWNVDRLGNPTGMTQRPYIFLSRKQNKERESTRTSPPITNDAHRVTYPIRDTTTENEIVEIVEQKTGQGQPISKTPSLLMLLHSSNKVLLFPF